MDRPELLPSLTSKLEQVLPPDWAEKVARLFLDKYLLGVRYSEETEKYLLDVLAALRSS